MKRFLILAILIFALLPLGSNAHGGVSQISGNTIVVLNQQPISPFVGEQVNMNFTFVDLSYHSLANLPVHLTLIDTFFGDATKDQTILQQDLKTDSNGNLNFSYTFDKENYFDVHLDFKDAAGKSNQVGFLVQPRQSKDSAAFAKYFIAALAGFLIGAAAVFVKKTGSKVN